MEPQQAEVARELIPDFNRWQSLVLLVFILELVAVVLTLAAGIHPDVLERFILLSLYLQCMGLCSAAGLYAARQQLRHAPVQVMFLVSWVLLVVINGAISAAGYEILPHVDPGFAVNPESRISFLFRHLIIGAVVSLLVLRLFWVQHQWRQQLRAEGDLRYQALQARIRPHFLFNSLNSIAALVGSKPEEAERLIEDMSELLRASLEARSRLVPLDSELALARAYLHIEQARLGERLNVHWDIAEDTTRLDVPLLSVQPLVENAIYHGVERGSGVGSVRIAAHRQEAMLRIEVSNSRPDADAASHEGQRLAVDNIVQRLALIYGDQARLELGEEGAQYVARLHLPVVKNA